MRETSVILVSTAREAFTNPEISLSCKHTNTSAIKQNGISDPMSWLLSLKIKLMKEGNKDNVPQRKITARNREISCIWS